MCLPSLLLLLHQTHHPLSTAILNEVNTSERWADLRSVLEAHRNVRLVLTGHFHKVGLSLLHGLVACRGSESSEVQPRATWGRLVVGSTVHTRFKSWW